MQSTIAPHDILKQKEQLSVARLTLSHFRNYEYTKLDFDTRPVVITGENGAGKTNILEAISFLSPGRGMRKVPLNVLDHAKQGKAVDPWAVAALLRTAEGEVLIGTGRDAAAENSKRIIKVDGELMKSQSELTSYFTVIWLTPWMDGLFLEGTSSRRKFLDRIVYHFDPEHAKRVNNYEYLVRERMKLLQQRGDVHWIATLEHKITEVSIAIAAARLETISRIQQTINASTTPFPKAMLAIEGWVEEQLIKLPAVQAEANLLEQLLKNRYRDRESGRTHTGTHKSDLKVLYSKKNMPAEHCSTGEQKALLLSIVLAETRARAEWKNSVPVLLLDEVVAHLDEYHRAALFAEVLSMGVQCWMTGTDISLFNGLQNHAQFLSISSGKISYE